MSKPTIAVVGASSNRNKFGNKCVRAYALKGYDVFPIHPRDEAVEGFKVYRSVADVPVPELDRISIYLPPTIGLQALPDIARKPAREVWFNPGADAPEVLAKARELGMNVIAACSIVDIGVSPYTLP
jgi:predicted CoA-binding protein